MNRILLVVLLVFSSFAAAQQVETYPFTHESNPTHEQRVIRYHSANGLNDADRKQLHGLTQAISQEYAKPEDKRDTAKIANWQAQKAKIMEKWEPSPWPEQKAKFPPPPK